MSEPLASPAQESRRKRLLKRSLRIFGASLAAWLLLAYVILPALWKHYEHQPALEDAPKTTVTAQGIPGDPLNVGFIGHETALTKALLAAGWHPVDPVTLKSSIKIAGSVLLDRSYNDAPVSNLFVFGRRQDLAFEKEAGKSASHRHHVRFWKSLEFGRKDNPLWIGAITFDKSVGVSHRTGQITHHIAADVDAERNLLIGEVSKGGWLTEIFQVTGVGATVLGRNGGGDPYYTDGELTIGVLVADEPRKKAAGRLDNPVAVQFKEQLWQAIQPLLQSIPQVVSNPSDEESGK